MVTCLGSGSLLRRPRLDIVPRGFKVEQVLLARSFQFFSNQLTFGLVPGLIVIATAALKIKVNEVGIEHVGFAIIPDFFYLALLIGVPDL